MGSSLRPKDARRAWRLFEPYHGVVYFAPDRKEIYGRAGLKGGWMGYFASRSAAMGPVPAEVVMATFYNFHPQMVRRAIPDAWTFSTPEKVLAARLEVADACVRRSLGELIDSDHVPKAAELAWRVAEAADYSGRPLAAAHSSLPRSEEPHLSLWQATSCLREHRGDGHVAILVSEGISGLEAHHLLVAAGIIPGDLLRTFRGFSEEEWEQAAESLRSRGFLGKEGLTEQGVALRARIESRTDELALQPWIDAGDDVYENFVEHMEVLAPPIRKVLPSINPVGLTEPEG